MLDRGTLNETEAAKYLGLSRSTLRQGRMNGPRKNRCPLPPFIKLGRRVLYLKSDLDQYLELNRASLSTNSQSGG